LIKIYCRIVVGKIESELGDKRAIEYVKAIIEDAPDLKELKTTLEEECKHRGTGNIYAMSIGVSHLMSTDPKGKISGISNQTAFPFKLAVPKGSELLFKIPKFDDPKNQAQIDSRATTITQYLTIQKFTPENFPLGVLSFNANDGYKITNLSKSDAEKMLMILPEGAQLKGTEIIIPSTAMKKIFEHNNKYENSAVEMHNSNMHTPKKP